MDNLIRKLPSQIAESLGARHNGVIGGNASGETSDEMKREMDDAAKFAAVLFHDEEGFGTYKGRYEYRLMERIHRIEDQQDVSDEMRRHGFRIELEV